MKKIYAVAAFILPALFCNANGQNDSLAESYVLLADEFKKNSKPDSAIVYYEKAYTEFQKLKNTEKCINAYNQIGALLTRQDKYNEARLYLDSAVSMGLSLPDAENLAVASAYVTLGVIYSAEENCNQSLEYHNKALGIRLSKLGEQHADVATSYGNIGNVYLRCSKDLDKSVDAHLKAMQIREKVFGSSGVEVIQSYSNLGNAYREKKDYQASLKYLNKALENKILQVGQGHKDLARYYKNISEVYYLMDNKEQGDFYKAKEDAVSKN